jgi:hypothetical protein
MPLDEFKACGAGLQDEIRVLRQQERDLCTHRWRHVRLPELCFNIDVLCASLQSGLYMLDFVRSRWIVGLLIDSVLISRSCNKIASR